MIPFNWHTDLPYCVRDGSFRPSVCPSDPLRPYERHIKTLISLSFEGFLWLPEALRDPPSPSQSGSGEDGKTKGYAYQAARGKN